MRRAAQRRLDHYLASQSPTRTPASQAAGDATGPHPERARHVLRATALAPNRLVNNRSSDTAPFSGQSAVSFGAFGRNLVAAWNGGEPAPG